MNEIRKKGKLLVLLAALALIVSSCKKDNTAPILTILGANPYIFCIIEDIPVYYDDPGATAYDDEDGDLTGSINVSSSVNEMVPGTYFVTYTVEDKAGNSATARREVQVMYCK